MNRCRRHLFLRRSRRYKLGLGRRAAADDQTAAALGIAIGAPCLVIGRHTWRSARTLTAVRLLYPGQSLKLIAGFKGGKKGYRCEVRHNLCRNIMRM